MDFYINGGEEEGFRESMVLDVYRIKSIRDPGTRREYAVSILVGQVKVISLFKNVAISRIVSLTSSDDTPVLKHRTVMLGDYVVPAGAVLDLTTLKKEHDAKENQEKRDSSDSGVSVPSKVLFHRGESKLTSTAMEALSLIHEKFNPLKNKYILIEGHTCSLGTDKYNLDLSRKRAQSVSQYFMNTKGVPPDRISIKYYGRKIPLASNETEEGREENRRVDIRFLPLNAAETIHSQS